VVTTVCGGRGKVFLLLLLLVDFVGWEDSTSAIICAASFCVRHGCICGWYNCVERLLMNSSSEYGVLVFHWYDNSFVGDICGIFSWHEVRPMEIEVMLPSVDKGTKEVEVISSGVHADKDDTVFGAQGEDGGGRKAIAIEVGMLIHLPVIGAVMFFAEEAVFKCVDVSDMYVCTRFKFMEFVGVPNVGVSEEVFEEGDGRCGRGCDDGLLSEARVLILIGCCSKSASNSGAWRSLELTHES